MMFARSIHQQVDVGEVEAAWLWLHLLPVDGRLHGVDVEIFEGCPGLGKRAGQELELLICAPRMRNGLPSTTMAK